MTSFYYYDQNPSGLCFLVQIRAFCYLNLTGITKFKSERKNEKDSSHSSKMTPSCKWPIVTSPLARESKTVLNYGLQGLDSGFQGLDSGFQMGIPDSRNWIPDSSIGFRISGIGFRIPGIGLWIPGIRFRILGIGFRIPGTGLWSPGIGFRILC